ncbi:uncharacterized protein LOC131318806 [Rhododendron vialii]|uniref:uncharacterized protein LOC131318806 n=1 Tax=Rhododendron vialii TaxID=182163 RepID=UPI00265FC2F1|nr:uncharacterized protein LOC131318806 [Rhododendron vialii]
MQKENASAPDRLVSTGLVSGIKFIQKMVTLGKKYQEADAERVRLMNDNTRLLRTIARLERERDKAKSDFNQTKEKLEVAEESLNQALSEIDNAKKAAYEEGYQKGFDTTTANYVEQIPAIQDQIWIACWETCLTKVGVAEDSPLWTDNELPSSRAAASQEQEVPLEDDFEQQIEDFTGMEEDIPSGSQAVQSPVRDSNPEPINFEENVTEGDVTTEEPDRANSDVQNLD